MESSRKKAVQVGVGTIVVIALTGWALSRSGISFTKAKDALSTFGPKAFFGSLFFCALQILGMILRVKSLFTPGIDPGYRTVAHAVAVGQAVNTFFPARAGDVLKAVLFTRTQRPHRPTLLQGAGVLLADRVTDISALILIVLVSGAYRMPGVRLPALPTWGGFGYGVVINLGLLILLVGWLLRRHLERLRTWFFQMRDGLAGLFSPKHAGLSVLFSAGAWFSEIFSLQILCSAQGIAIDFPQAIFILVVLNLAIAVPVSMANVGAFEGSIIFALSTMGATMEQGLAVATVHHSMQLVAISLWALTMLAISRSRKGEPTQISEPATLS